MNFNELSRTPFLEHRATASEVIGNILRYDKFKVIFSTGSCTKYLVHSFVDKHSLRYDVGNQQA